MEQKPFTAFMAELSFPQEVKEVVEPLLLKDPSLRPSLAGSPSLSEEAWFDLYKLKPLVKIEPACKLTYRSLSKKQIDFVLKNEKRTGALFNMLRKNALDKKEQELLLVSKGFKPELAELWLKASWCEEDLKAKIAKKAEGLVLLRFLAASSEKDISDQEAMELLTNFSTWCPPSQKNERLGQREATSELSFLFAKRPGLLKAATLYKQHQWVRAAAAGCRHLTDPAMQYLVANIKPGQEVDYDQLTKDQYLLMALVNNPPTDPKLVDEIYRLASAQKVYGLSDSAFNRKRVHPDALLTPYEKVSDLKDLSWVANRTLRSDYRPQGRPFDLQALVKNPFLSDAHVEKVYDFLRYSGLSVFGKNFPEMLKSFLETYPAQGDFAKVMESFQGELEALEPSEYVYSDAFWTIGKDEVLGTSAKFFNSPRTFVPASKMAVEAFGSNKSAWETFFKLAAEFDGNYKELLELCVML